MRASFFTFAVLVPFTALVAAACGSRSGLYSDPGGGGAGAGGGGAGGSGAGGSGGTDPCQPDCPTSCDGDAPECFDCGGNPVAAECQGEVWVCPATPCLCAPAIWQQTAGGVGSQAGSAVALAPGGDVVVGGSFGGTLTLGGATFTSAQPDKIHEHDAVVARFLADGTHLWSVAFGDFGDDFVDDVLVDENDDTTLVGTYQSEQSVAGFTLPGGPARKLFVVKLNAAGKVIYAHGFAGGANGTQARAALAPGGDVVLAGDTSGTIDFGGGVLAGDGTRDVIVVRLDPLGEQVYARRFAGTTHEFATDVAIGPNGDTVVVGSFRDTLDFGLGPLTSAGDFDDFVIHLDSLGNVLQSAAFGGPGREGNPGVAVDSAGNVALTGSYSDGASFGGPKLTTPALNGLVASYDPGGGLRWAVPFTGANADVQGDDVFRLAVDSQDNVVLAGQFAGSLAMGDAVLQAEGDVQLVVARIRADGEVLGVCGYGSVNAEITGDVAVDPVSREVLLTGSYWGELDLGLGPLNNDSNGDMFHARLPATAGK